MIKIRQKSLKTHTIHLGFYYPYKSLKLCTEKWKDSIHLASSRDRYQNYATDCAQQKSAPETYTQYKMFISTEFSRTLP